MIIGRRLFFSFLSSFSSFLSFSLPFSFNLNCMRCFLFVCFRDISFVVTIYHFVIVTVFSFHFSFSIASNFSFCLYLRFCWPTLSQMPLLNSPSFSGSFQKLPPVSARRFWPQRTVRMCNLASSSPVWPTYCFLPSSPHLRFSSYGGSAASIYLWAHIIFFRYRVFCFRKWGGRGQTHSS